MDLITYALCKKHGGESITYTLTADTENKTIVLTPSEGTAQVITVPYATDASTVNGHEVPELENGKIPANFLPSFVDNVDEYDSISLFPVVGESNRIYIDKSTNKTYRWSGTAYVEISESIALGETSSTAYRGDRGKIAYDHSQSAHAPSNAEANQNAFSNVKIDSDIINASTKTDTLEFIAGDNIILTPNVSNKKITVSQVPVRETASGDIASFSDGAGYPFLKVKANINPVQDLHGYDYPWVGGAGTNKFNPADLIANRTLYGTDAVGTSPVLHNSTASKVYKNIAYLNANTTYVISFRINGSMVGSIERKGYICDNDGLVLENNLTTQTPTDNYITITPTVSGWLWGCFDNSTTDLQLELGSSATSYAPYSNICPISGWSGANVTRCGVNLFDKDSTTVSNVTFEGPSETTTRSGFELTLPNGNYSLKCFGATAQSYIYVYKNNAGNYVDVYKLSTTGGWQGVNISVDTGDVLYVVAAVSGTTLDLSFDLDITTGTTPPTSYSPYQGSTTFIPFHDNSDNPITVYGGWLNVTSGELTATLASADLGNLTWTYNVSQFYQRFYSAELQTMVKKPASDDAVASAVCSNYPLVSAAAIYSGRDKAVSIGANGTLSVADSTYTDATTFKTAMSGVQLVYALATPITYQLTPQQINTLIGQNNVWNNTNGQTEVEYKAPFYNDLTTKNEVQVLINESITSALNASY